MPTNRNEMSDKMIQKIDAYWRAANYLSVGQMYLRDNPLLRQPLEISHVKSVLLGHWGTTPGQNFIYTHLNRAIKEHDLNMIYVSGPGHGGPALVAQTYLEGTYSEIYPEISQDEKGLKKLFTQFSFPGGISSHVSPECPGSIHEGGELGYSLSHSFGAVLDNPDLIVACVIGDGEAETGPLATSWHSNKFMNPITDGAVLPILHLNGYKIANPSIFARLEEKELEALLIGYGWKPYFVEGNEPEIMHEKMVAVLDEVVGEIKRIQKNARESGDTSRPKWPMIVFKSPKGWSGPKVVNGLPNENSFRSHQVPVVVDGDHYDNLLLLETWMKSYRPEELFDNDGRLKEEFADLAPRGAQRMGSNPHANGGLLLKELALPDFKEYAVEVKSPGSSTAADTSVLGEYLRDVIKLNEESRNFRIFGPDETISNRLNSIFEATTRQWNAMQLETDEFLSADGRVMEMLSEHQCEGWLEGYLLTGRHGLFNSYEAFIHVVDSMFNQHAKWLDVTSRLPWRKKIASLNYLLTSHVWQQAHNGFTHQDPGFIDLVLNKKPDIVRVYLPPDANCLLSVMDQCLRSQHRANVVIASKYQTPQWLNMEEAEKHCSRGIGVWDWASNDDGEPDVVVVGCGDVPTREALATITLLNTFIPELKVRMVNVVDLQKLQSPSKHPNGLTDDEFDAIFTRNKPVIFAFHGYPSIIHSLTYRRANHANFHVHGYHENGAITTAFDMTVLNKLDRFHLAIAVLKRLQKFESKSQELKEFCQRKLSEHEQYITKYGEDMPDVQNWKWDKEGNTEG